MTEEILVTETPSPSLKRSWHGWAFVFIFAGLIFLVALLWLIGKGLSGLIPSVETTPFETGMSLGVLIGGIAVLVGIVVVVVHFFKNKSDEKKAPDVKGGEKEKAKGGGEKLDLSLSVAETIENEKKKKKAKKEDAERRRTSPFWLVVPATVGVLWTYASLYWALRIVIPENAHAGTREIYLILAAIVFMFYLVNLANGKKGPRPVAITVGWIFSLLGLGHTLLAIFGDWFDHLRFVLGLYLKLQKFFV